MSNIDKITNEMEAEVKRSKGGIFWRLLLVWMKEVNKQIQNKPASNDELAEV
ncbi:hypothetical protein HYN73_00815 [Vibrio parahaemolyticus]|uniref:hypothetical protein n=1 Tax=Vibrio TaxID=662 RepID=UPI000243B5EC|nr:MULTISPECIES: hypothetical protein [Vibrio]AEX21986.1 hypothetical protein VEJY3_07480 [Vibrio sp. EJY3]MBM5189609.1 hypothetical protein [Vibrio parahaemolyticus]MBM5201912.1 hypothetical protein [Vibrio parahaemolyticus]MBM5206374.1 hypothetical protein [Vibrio parahaemolyticus]MBM5207757.1 hypothetical protein [Vibrio parahaemolyticus]